MVISVSRNYNRSVDEIENSMTMDQIGLYYFLNHKEESAKLRILAAMITGASYG